MLWHDLPTELSGYLYKHKQRFWLTQNQSKNRPAINGSFRKKNVEPIKLESVFMTRADYNDLGDTFQITFKQVADKKLDTKKLNLKPKVTNGLIVGVEIDDYDNFTKELFEEGGSYDEEMSRHDLEGIYNLLCFKLIAKQTDENLKLSPDVHGKAQTASIFI